MHAIVLVGGFGTRLRPLTDTVPKSMLTVGNEPIITRLVRRLERAGITSVTLSLGFLPDIFIAAFRGGRCGSVAMGYAVEPHPLDTAGAIRFAANVADVDDTFVVVNGDVITDLDIAALVSAHRASGAEATIHLTPVDDPSAFGVVEIDRAGRVERFLEKPAVGVTDSNLINAGTYVMEPSVLDQIEPNAPTSVERVTFPGIAARGALFAVATDDYWLDVGRPELYRQANLDLLAGRYDALLPGIVNATGGIDHDAQLADDCTVRDCVVAAGVAIGRGSRVTRSVLLAGSSVGKDVVMEDSVVMGSVSDGAVLSGAVIGASATVRPGQQVTNERIPAPAP
jgi:mannose-1-phosphate guanylyltransferase